MRQLIDYVKRLAESRNLSLEADGLRLVLPVGSSGRHQKIHFERDGTDYLMTTVILGSTLVTNDVSKWRCLAKLAWHRNAEHEIVTFAFDKRDRLVGQIRHPADHLDYQELELYVTTLATECDRFEYLLSGRDIF
jgi:hypothetical protein